MQIFETKTAPNPRRVRIFLAEKDIPMNYVQIDMLKGEQFTPEFRARNALAQVPVLELDDGSYLSESVAICRYFEELQPEPALFGSSPREKAEVEMWNRRVELNFLFPTGMCFQHTHPFFKPFKPQVPEWGELCRARSEAFFKVLNTQLSQQPFVAGANFSIADITALCTIDFARVIQLKIKPDHTHLLRWHQAVSQRPSAQA
ncbi:MAG: glutathione S-transferase [Hahellaceae bacterium]|nr:glutathione S-transferase [Hahellaceae bacterium]